MSKGMVRLGVVLLITTLILCGCNTEQRTPKLVEYETVETSIYNVSEITDNINETLAKIDDGTSEGIITPERRLSSDLTVDLQIDIYEPKEKISADTQSEISIVGTIGVEPLLISDKHKKYFQIYKDIPLEDSLKELVFEYCEYYKVPVYMAIACMDVGSHFDINFHNELQLRWGLMCTRWDFVPTMYFNPVTRTAEIPVEVSLEIGINALRDYIDCADGDIAKIAMCFEWGGIASARNLWKSGGGLSEFSRRLVDKINYYRLREEKYV